MDKKRTHAQIPVQRPRPQDPPEHPPSLCSEPAPKGWIAIDTHIHKDAAHIVAPGLEQRRCMLWPHLNPARLRMQGHKQQ